MRAASAALERLARAADAGGERDAIALGLLGEGAEHALHRVGQRVERRRLHRVGDAERQADALDQPVAEPAEDQPANALRMGEREEGGDARPHRIAHRVGPLDAEMVEQARRVGRHQRRMVGRRVGRLVALAVAAIVEGDHPPAVVGQRLDPARIDPVDAMVGGEAVDQQDRLAAVAARAGRRR